MTTYPAMNRASFFRSLQEGINEIVLSTDYERYSPEWSAVYTEKPSKKAYEELVMRYGMGLPSQKSEGGPVASSSGGDAWNYILRHETWGLGFAITEEAMEDNLYGQIAAEFGEELRTCMDVGREIRAMIPINNATDGTNYPLGDGVALLSTAHPLYNGGTYANKPTVDLDLSETLLIDMTKAIATWTDDRGKPIVVQPLEMWITPANWDVADRLLKSTQRPGGNDNDINVLNGLLPGGYKVFHYWTDDDMVLIKTNAKRGAFRFNRRPLKTGMQGDFETGNVRYKATERDSFGVFNPRFIWGSTGS